VRDRVNPTFHISFRVHHPTARWADWPENDLVKPTVSILGQVAQHSRMSPPASLKEWVGVVFGRFAQHYNGCQMLTVYSVNTVILIWFLSSMCGWAQWTNTFYVRFAISIIEYSKLHLIKYILLIGSLWTKYFFFNFSTRLFCVNW
jgi:hypothetical protein